MSLRDDTQRALDLARTTGIPLVFTPGAGWQLDLGRDDPFEGAPLADDDLPSRPRGRAASTYVAMWPMLDGIGFDDAVIAAQQDTLAMLDAQGVRLLTGMTFSVSWSRATGPVLVGTAAAASAVGLADDDPPLAASGKPRRRRRPDSELKPCGTHAAHNRHVKRGEPIDAACRDAEIAYNTARKRQQHGRRRGAAA